MTTAAIRRLIYRAGREPHERDTLYNLVATLAPPPIKTPESSPATPGTTPESFPAVQITPWVPSTS